MNNEAIQTNFFQNSLFLLQCIEEFDIRIFLKYHARMREESEYSRPQIRLFGTVYEAFKYLAVPYMYTIKCTNGYGSELLFIVFGNVLNC